MVVREAVSMDAPLILLGSAVMGLLFTDCVASPRMASGVGIVFPG